MLTAAVHIRSERRVRDLPEARRPARRDGRGALEAEEVLQQLLADYPNLLGGDGDSATRKRWLLVRREIGVPAAEGSPDRWSADHLFLDEAGVPTLVEVKRSADTRIRREIVGQMLDYAANAASFWGVASIRTAFELRQGGEDEAELAVLAFVEGAIDSVEEFWDRVGVNLQAGKLRVVFVADEIPSELRRIIEFLNEHRGQELRNAHRPEPWRGAGVRRGAGGVPAGRL